MKSICCPPFLSYNVGLFQISCLKILMKSVEWESHSRWQSRTRCFIFGEAIAQIGCLCFSFFVPELFGQIRTATSQLCPKPWPQPLPRPPPFPTLPQPRSDWPFPSPRQRSFATVSRVLRSYSGRFGHHFHLVGSGHFLCLVSLPSLRSEFMVF
ncbi:hypothetical protein RchiOBHm_Chr6g0284281 [Rosa chinensis]|uniref:Uncharacterized protein n=1 Tax=Rosa chinensis TaxID=74649 RepID=A0A2P6PU92_ROSCH|nr:hypothetical protein RchiOBHm_Chr6g0284281 [Rosa chinensis]